MEDRVLEREANLFACLLLMPSKPFIEDMAEGIDLFDDKYIAKLSSKYKVPESAVVFRIMYYVEHKY